MKTDYEQLLEDCEKLQKAINIIKQYPYLIKIILDTVLTYGINNVKEYDLLKEVLL